MTGSCEQHLKAMELRSFAHLVWRAHVKNGDLVIDATCGRGKDTLFLTSLGAKVYSFDIQQEAIDSARNLVGDKAIFILGSHEKLDLQNASLIVYNLGYLPGGNKAISTRVETTLASVQSAVSILRPRGMIHITCYGHEEGKKEQEALLSYFSTLDKRWTLSHHRWLNRKNAPSQLIVTSSR